MNRLNVGDVVKHFKYETLSEEDKKMNKYVYKILCVGIHSETGERMVVYVQLYSPFRVHIRPLEMFISEVDKEKYPNIKSKYRFESFNQIYN